MSVWRPIKIFDPDKKYAVHLDRTAYLITQVKNKSVLHIGCADYPLTEERLLTDSLLHKNIQKSASSVFGIDNSEKGTDILIKKGFDNVTLMDAENVDLEMKFDIILAGDVLEHMNNPGMLLQKVSELLNPFGTLIIGVPNAYSFNVFRYVLRDFEPTHKDHCYFFSPKTLTELCSRYHLVPTKLIYTVQPESKYTSNLSVLVRRLLVNVCKKLAPSFIMHFQDKELVNHNKYFLWR